jgi:hypothetical protein
LAPTEPCPLAQPGCAACTGGAAMTVTLGVDPHKASHTVVATDPVGRQLTQTTSQGTRTSDHQELIGWARQRWPERTWAVEDCRHVPVGCWRICWRLESRWCWCHARRVNLAPRSSSQAALSVLARHACQVAGQLGLAVQVLRLLQPLEGPGAEGRRGLHAPVDLIAEAAHRLQGIAGNRAAGAGCATEARRWVQPAPATSSGVPGGRPGGLPP